MSRSFALAALALMGCAHLPPPVEPLASTPRPRFPASPTSISFEPTAAPPVVRFQLENGLQIFVLERPDESWISVQYAARRGAEDGAYAEPGVMTFVMALATLDSGTPALASSEDPPVVQGYVDRSGGYLVSGARPDDIEGVLRELVAVITTPEVDERKVKSEVYKQLDAIEHADYQADELAHSHALQLLYGDQHPFGQTLAGSLSGLARQRLFELEEHHRRMFSPDGSALIFAGGITAARAKELGERYLSGLAPVKKPAIRRMSLATSTHHTRAVWATVDFAVLVEAFSAPAAGASEQVVCEALNLIAADLFASRINQALRVEEGHTYGVHGEYEARRGSGSWLLKTRVDASNLRKTLYLIDEQLEQLRTRPIEKSELERARVQLRERRRAQLSSSAAAAGLMAEAFVLSSEETPLDIQALWNAYYQRVASLEPVEIGELARRMLDLKERGLAISGNIYRFEGALRGYDADADVYLPEYLITQLEQAGIAVRR